MNALKKLTVAGVVLSTALGCVLFDEPTPENVSFRMSGPAGVSVVAIYSKDFIAGSNELGETRVTVMGTDTVNHVLPIDTIINISESTQFFVQVESTDTLAVSVVIDVDDRSLVNSQGGIFPGEPWRYVYQFNRFFGTIVEVII